MTMEPSEKPTFVTYSKFCGKILRAAAVVINFIFEAGIIGWVILRLYTVLPVLAFTTCTENLTFFWDGWVTMALIFFVRSAETVATKQVLSIAVNNNFFVAAFIME